MNTFAKVMVVVVLLLSCGFAVSQMALYSKREMWREKYVETRDQLEDTSSRAEDLEDELSDVRSDREQMKQRKDREIKDLEEKVENKDLEITKLERDNEDLETDLKDARNRMESLGDRIEEKNGVIEELESKVAELDESLKDKITDNDELKDEVREKTNRIDSLDEKVAELEEQKRKLAEEREELESVLSQMEARGIHTDISEVPAIDAQVVRVDNEVGAVVLNRGKNADVKVGYPFTIYRGQEFVARAHVMEVHEDYSLARIDKELTWKDLETGDDATTRIQ